MRGWTSLLAWGFAMSAWGGPIYLQIEGIPGEAQARNHEEWIEVASFAGGLVGGTGGPAAGQPSARTVPAAELTFLKSTDKSSPKLAAALCRGDVLPKARFEFLTTDSRALRFYVVELEQVQVTAWEAAGESPERPSERVGFDFVRATWTYTELSGSGQPLVDHQAYWDFVRQQGGSGSVPRGFRISAEFRPGQAIGLRWTPEPGRRYQLLRSADPAGPYVPIREIGASPSGEERSEELPAKGRLDFFLLRKIE